MYRHAALIALVALSPRALDTGLDARARVGAPPELAGTYVLDASASDDPRRAIEAATASMRRRARSAVRDRLETAAKPADTLTIATRGDTIEIRSRGQRALSTVPGEPRTITGDKGRRMEIASSWDGDVLVVRTTAEQLTREARYTLAPDGVLRLAITTDAPRLSSPIRYTLVYRKAR